MAIIGVTIGATFGVSMVAGPVLSRIVGVPGIFALTGVLALAALAVVRWVVPDPAVRVRPKNDIDNRAGQPPTFASVLAHPGLGRLNYGIFVLHAVLMALFVVVPFSLRNAGLPAASHWQVYLPVMAGSVLLMVPPMILSERRGQQKLAFLASIGVLLAAQVLLALPEPSLVGIAVALLVFFAGFNLLEASLPSLISKTAPPQARGTAAGVYSSVQFLGTFAGATAGGVVSQHFGAAAVFLLCGMLTLSWLLVAWPMRAPAAVGLRT
jgi:predicted MFS family arabinose efflux permease